MQNQNSKGVYLMKKLPFHVIGALCGRPFWSNTWLPTDQIWADQFFLIILNLKSKISLGHFNAKGCYRPKLAWSDSDVDPRLSAEIFWYNILIFGVPRWSSGLERPSLVQEVRGSNLGADFQIFEEEELEFFNFSSQLFRSRGHSSGFSRIRKKKKYKLWS